MGLPGGPGMAVTAIQHCNHVCLGYIYVYIKISNLFFLHLELLHITTSDCKYSPVPYRLAAATRNTYSSPSVNLSNLNVGLLTDSDTGTHPGR